MPYKFTKRELNRSVFTNGKLLLRKVNLATIILTRSKYGKL